MILVKKIRDLQDELQHLKKAGKKIGFVPTMGALHDGHISLVVTAKAENDICACSIFVNPAQFNNAADLQHYPVTIESDIDQLEKAGCDLLFLPSVNEMYAAGETAVHYELGYLETILEGKYRPGHFQGVCRIVDKLLAAVLPDALYLGRKDYQQCIVIEKMMQDRGYKSKLHICDTVREKDGLAMSSRNMRLNEQERKQAPGINEALRMMKANFANKETAALKKEVVIFLETNGFTVDYAEIADAGTLLPLENETKHPHAVALIAAYLNKIRLIDNLFL